MSVLDYVRHHLWPCTLLITVISLPGPLAVAAPPSARPMVHGLWVWNAASILDSPAESKKLRDFAVAQRINEIYLSALSHGKFADAGALCSLVDSLHHSQVRSQALLSSTNADEPGEHRQRLLEEIKAVIHFDLEHAHCRFCRHPPGHRTTAAA